VALADLARRANRAVPALANRWFDRRHGVRTRGIVQLADLGVAGANRVWHDPSDTLLLRRALRRLGVGPSDVFLDLGAGKGRALLVAAREPFARFLGVEISPELVAVARANVAAVPAARGRVELVCGDAAAYAIPDDVSVAYLFCPFTGPVFAAVVANLLASYDRRPRPLHVLYLYPFEHDHLIATRRIAPVAVTERPWVVRRETGDLVVTYRVGPPSSYDPARPAPGLGAWGGAHGPGLRLDGEFERASA
jgi:SAM-dependent methyltransferase